MKHKGFVSTGMIYTLLVVFLVLTFSTLHTMNSKKTVLDNLKEETVSALYCNENVVNDLKAQIKELQNTIVEKNEEIENLKNKGNATAAEILSGKKAMVNGEEVIGTMNDINGNMSAKGAYVTAELTKFQIATSGYYDSSNYLYVGNSTLATQAGLTAAKLLKGQTVLGVTGTATSDATALASHILFGRTAYVNGSKVTGTMVNKSGQNVNSTAITESGDNAVITIPVNGYYSTKSTVSVPIETIKNNVSSLGGSKTVIDLGTGTSFNIQELVPDIDYTSLTASDFIVEPVSMYGYGVGGYHFEGDAYDIGTTETKDVSTSSNLSKSYNTSTGVLNCSLSANNSRQEFYNGTSNGSKRYTISGGGGWVTNFHAYLIK